MPIVFDVSHVVQHQVAGFLVLTKTPQIQSVLESLAGRFSGDVDNYVAAKASRFNRFQHAGDL